MKSAIFATLAVATLSSVSAIPTIKRDGGIDDTTILNYALTLEHLENAFYSGALAKFDDNAFTQAGFPSWVRSRFVQIAAHEKTHVDFLSTALGTQATQPCEYSFPYTDPKSFAALSQALEGTGVSAYLGAAQFITNKAYLTAAASVLTTEARHAAWVSSAVDKYSAWSGALDVPLSFDQVYTIAATFITSCPTTNPTLPVKAFPALSFDAPAPSQQTQATFAKPDGSGPLYASFFTGLSQVFAPVADDGTVVIPAGLQGTVYAVITSNSTQATDDNIVAGPAILQFEYTSSGQPE